MYNSTNNDESQEEPPTTKMVSYQLLLPEYLRRLAKVKAARKGVALAHILRGFLIKWLAEEEKEEEK